MKNYIFISQEGFTFQPNSQELEPDIENCQVVGFSSGNNPKEAFSTLLEENRYLLYTSFNELICYEIASSKKEYFYLSNNSIINT